MGSNHAVTNFNSKFLTEFKEFEFLGQGSYGVVYKVSRSIDGVSAKSSKEEFAIKLVQIDEFNSEKAKRESKIQSNFDHVNIVKVFDSWFEAAPPTFKYPNMHPIPFTSPGVLMIQMELCYISLFHYLTSEWKNYEHGITFLYHVAQGLAHLHDHNIIHRDLKPANILLKFDTVLGSVVAKISDFGFATEQRSRMTSQLGTAGYRAPEVAEHGGKYTKKADIYSLGRILLDLTNSIIDGDTSSSCVSTISIFNPDITQVPQLRNEKRELFEVMMSNTPTERPDAIDVVEKFKSWCGEACPKIPEFTGPFRVYDKSQVIQVGKKEDHKVFTGYSSQKQQVTKLYFKWVRIDGNNLHSLLSTLSSTLENLDLTISGPTVEPIGYTFVNLPKLVTFDLHELLFDASQPDMDITKERLRNMLFFGNTESELIEKLCTWKISVKLSYGKKLLVDIGSDWTGAMRKLSKDNEKEKRIYLDGDSTEIFLKNLTHFSDLTSLRIHNVIDPLTKFNGENIPERLTKLILVNVSLDIKSGSLFQKFTELTELAYHATLQDELNVTNYLLLASLPRKLTHLSFSNVRLDPMDFKKIELEWLSLDSCIFHQFIASQYVEYFSANELTILVTSDPIIKEPAYSYFRPSLELFGAIVESENPSVILRFGEFDWNAKGANAKYAHYEENILDLRIIPKGHTQFMIDTTSGNKWEGKIIKEMELLEILRIRFYSFPGSHEEGLEVKERATETGLHLRLPDLPVVTQLVTLSSGLLELKEEGHEYEGGFKEFGVIPKESHNKFGRITLNCILIRNNIFLASLTPCKNLESIILNNVKLSNDFIRKIDLPKIREFHFLIHDDPSVEAQQRKIYSTREKLESLLFFTRSSWKEIWLRKVKVSIGVGKFKLIDLNPCAGEVSIQNLEQTPEFDILHEIENCPNESANTIQSVVVFDVNYSGLRKSLRNLHYLTELNLGKVSEDVNGLFVHEDETSVCFPNLKTFYYNPPILGKFNLGCIPKSIINIGISRCIISGKSNIEQDFEKVTLFDCSFPMSLVCLSSIKELRIVSPKTLQLDAKFLVMVLENSNLRIGYFDKCEWVAGGQEIEWSQISKLFRFHEYEKPEYLLIEKNNLENEGVWSVKQSREGVKEIDWFLGMNKYTNY